VLPHKITAAAPAQGLGFGEKSDKTTGILTFDAFSINEAPKETGMDVKIPVLNKKT